MLCAMEIGGETAGTAIALEAIKTSFVTARVE